MREPPQALTFCWTRHENTNLEGPWSEPRCRRRFAFLAEALDACERETKCGGITMDRGFYCGIPGDARLATPTWPGVVRQPFRFELRGGPPARPWPSMVSFTKGRGGLASGCLHTKESLAAAVTLGAVCPARALTDGDAANATNFAPLSAARLSLEASSAVEGAAEDAEEVRLSRCPAAAAPSRRPDAARTRCPAQATLSEQLEAIGPSVQMGEGCAGAAPPGGCTLLHSGRNDGWGAQHFRRASLFVAAVRLGCRYEHVPIAPMNAHSKTHGVDASAAERFFGLGHGCAAASGGRAQASVPCSQGPLGDTPADVMPPRSAHIVGGLCNASVLALVREWRAGIAGRKMVCEYAPSVPFVTRCSYLRAIAALRMRYFAAHGGRPPLPWYDTEGGDARAADTLQLHVAVHIRRGDLWFRDAARQVRDVARCREMSRDVARWQSRCCGPHASVGVRDRGRCRTRSGPSRSRSSAPPSPTFATAGGRARRRVGRRT